MAVSDIAEMIGDDVVMERGSRIDQLTAAIRELQATVAEQSARIETLAGQIEPPMPRRITEAEFAKYVGLSATKIRQMRANGKLANLFYWDGGRVFYLYPKSVIEFFDVMSRNKQNGVGK